MPLIGRSYPARARIGRAPLSSPPASISFVSEIGLQAGNTMFWPGSQLTGDMAIALVANKILSDTPSTPSGWTSLGTADVGTGVDGAGTGQIKLTAYYMQLVTNSPTDPSFSFTPNVVLCGGTIWRKSGGTWQTPYAVFGSDTTSGTGFATTGTNIAPAVGDYITGYSASTANSGISGGRAIALTGWTVTDTGLNSGGTANGNDLFVWTDYMSVNSGSGTGTPTATATHAASTSGGTIFVKVSLTSGAPPSSQFMAWGIPLR